RRPRGRRGCARPPAPQAPTDPAARSSRTPRRRPPPRTPRRDTRARASWRPSARRASMRGASARSRRVTSETRARGPTSAPPVWRGSRLHARVIGDPVQLPGLAAVGREGLLEVAGVGASLGDHEADLDRTPVEILVVEEFAAAAVEAADRRLGQRARGAVGEVQAPPARARVVEAEAQPLPSAR